MSESIQDSKKIIRQGRKNKLIDRDNVKVVVSLKDQIPQKLASKLRQDKFGSKIEKIWRSAQANRREWLDRQLIYQQDFDEYKYSYDYGGAAQSTDPAGVSQLHIPMPLTVVKNVHARFMQAITAELSPTVIPRREDSIEKVQMIKGLMSYTLKEWANNYEGVEETLDLFVWDWISMGEAVLKIRWDTKYDTFQDVGNFIEEDDPVEGVDSQGNVVKAPNAKVVQEEVRRLKKVFSGPMFEHKPLEDIITVGDRDPQKADYLFDAYGLTASELNTLSDEKIFDEAAVKKIIEAGHDSKSGEESYAIKQRRAENAGKAGLDTEPDQERWRILEVYCGYDVEGSGIQSQIIAWVHPASGEVLRATYLNRINKSGRRPYFKASYMMRQGQEHGLGLLEILHPLSIEMDFHHNARVDFGLFTAMPFGFYRASSSVDPERFKIQPGDMIPLEDPSNDVVFPNLGSRTAFGMQEEQSIQTMVERVTGVNDLSLGVITGAQGPTRTATGARGLQQEANANLDVHLRRLNRMWRSALRYTLQLLQQRVEPGFVFGLTGEDGQNYWLSLRNREDIAGDFDFELSPSSATSNPQIQQERANFISSLQQNPMLLTTGIVTPENLWEAARLQLVSVGIQDPNRYITKPQGYNYAPTPEEEANRLLRGIEVPVLPQADHQGFIDYVSFLMTNDELLSQFSPDDVSRLAAQQGAHQQMMQSLQQAQAQTANKQQQLTNSLQGLGQANTNLPGRGE